MGVKNYFLLLGFDAGPADWSTLFVPGTDIDGPHALQHITRELTAHLQIAQRAAQLADESLRLAAGLVERLSAGGGKLFGALAFELGNMTTFTATSEAPRLIEKAKLHGII